MWRRQLACIGLVGSVATGCTDNPGDQADAGSMSTRAIAELRADASRVVDAADGATSVAGERARSSLARRRSMSASQ